MVNNNIQIKEEYFDILRDQEITGSTFFKITEETYRSYGLKGGPAKIFVEFAKDFMEKKKRPFSSYKTLTDLKSVLNKFNIYGSSLSAVSQFTPSSLSLADDDDELQQCMNDIKRKRETDKEISLLPQLQIMGDENCGRFVQNVIQCESALQTNRKKHKAGVALGVTLKHGGGFSSFWIEKPSNMGNLGEKLTSLDTQISRGNSRIKV
ncbi:hypothetical protein GLOIN_2v1476258 [Rhizophagus irregularis DAOM 181602=DAOM 197198]|nr:hypothetical protein GLOIN_2v1476258 [Rhizophagus irregularis DAOM 181602=DAOM 197198]